MGWEIFPELLAGHAARVFHTIKPPRDPTSPRTVRATPTSPDASNAGSTDERAHHLLCSTHYRRRCHRAVRAGVPHGGTASSGR
ncbi:MAG: hypothetical protein M0C28_19495 [Candidatus Moduliflexus flocculans]|nr:hypothetical protein [Candidatus Moduliflexus flocculans]